MRSILCETREQVGASRPLAEFRSGRPLIITGSAETLLTREQLEKDTAFLRAENLELQAKLTAQQRRVDMLSSARLVTGRLLLGGWPAPR